MADSSQMPKASVTKADPALDATTIQLMKLIEKENLERVQKLQKIRRKNIFTGILLGGAVIGIYSYSILSVKQETFLDDFEEPKLVQPKEDNRL